MLTAHSTESQFPMREARITDLPVLIVHAHSRCNCRCAMCDIWKTADSRQFTMRDLERILPSIRELRVQSVVFTGGEPLMNAELPAIARRLRDCGVRLTLLSTGLLLERYAEEIAASFDEIIVSVDGPPAVHDRIRGVPGAYSAMSAGIRAVQRIRPELPVRGRMVVQKSNHNCLLESIDCSWALGLKSISFLAADLTSQAFNRQLVWPVPRQMEIGLSEAELSALAEEVEEIIRRYRREIDLGFVVESPAKLRRIVAHFAAHLGLQAPVAPVCNAPWNSAVVEVDGKVRPCFFHAPIGSVTDTSLEEVLNGPAGIEFRRALDVASNPICRRCVCSLNYREGGSAADAGVHTPV